MSKGLQLLAAALSLCTDMLQTMVLAKMLRHELYSRLLVQLPFTAVGGCHLEWQSQCAQTVVQSPGMPRGSTTCHKGCRMIHARAFTSETAPKQLGLDQVDLRSNRLCGIFGRLLVAVCIPA